MTKVDQMERFLKRVMPADDVVVERYPQGRAWLNVRRPKQLVTVEYRPRVGFNISSFKSSSLWAGFGDRPHETFATLEEAQQYISDTLVVNRKKTGKRR